MKGRSEFTQEEIDDIRRIVRQKTGASVSRQKQLRQQMRERGFHVSDFGYQGHGFREADLDRLLAKGQVRITGGESGPVSWWRRPMEALRRWWA